MANYDNLGDLLPELSKSKIYLGNFYANTELVGVNLPDLEIFKEAQKIFDDEIPNYYKKKPNFAEFSDRNGVRKFNWRLPSFVKFDMESLFFLSKLKFSIDNGADFSTLRDNFFGLLEPFDEHFWTNLWEERPGFFVDKISFTINGQKRNNVPLAEACAYLLQDQSLINRSKSVSLISTNLEIIWWMIAENEFLALKNFEGNFGEWLEEKETIDFLDSKYLNLDLGDFYHSRDLSQVFKGRKTGFIHRGTQVTTLDLLKKLNVENFKKIISTEASNYGNTRQSQDAMKKKIQDVLTPPVSQTKFSFTELVTKSALAIVEREGISGTTALYLAGTLNRANYVRYRTKGKMDFDAKLVGEALWKNCKDFTLKEFFVFMDALYNPELWISNGKDYCWTIAGQFAQGNNFSDFVQTVVEYSLSKNHTAPTRRQWKEICDNGSSLIALGATMVSSLVVSKEIETSAAARAKRNLFASLKEIENSAK